MTTKVKALDESAILALLDTVPDPEIPAVSITDLGIVRGFASDPPSVLVTPTYSGCPATIAIEQSIRAALDSAGYDWVHIQRVLFPPWTTDWISERGRDRLQRYGISPPDPAAAAICPRCGSTDTQEVSRFGSTPCKAQWRCIACHEPFDRFKCH